jgi:gamma-glutamyltranspeptidase/glutathione hydrolase
MSMPDIRYSHCRRLIACVAAAACLCAVFAFQTGRPTVATATPVAETVAGVDVTVPHAVVVTADSIASAVGNQVLLDGGNAVDAAVAASFALAVTFPRAGNIGGGGFMLIRLTDGQETFLDYRETAPAGARRDMYLDDNGEVVVGRSTVGHLAAGVPGTVHGLARAHEEHGTLPWERLVEPAIRLAREGFPVGPALAASLQKKRPLLERHDGSRRIFVVPDYQRGDTIVQPQLAETLERIAADWRDFYRGETARLIAAEMRRGGGLITMEDLAAYRAVWREPIRFHYRGFAITSAPLPSSGGVILAQILQILEHHDASSLDPESTAYVHLVAEAEKVAYRCRAQYLGDTDFYPSPWEELIADSTVARLAGLISSAKRLSVGSLQTIEPLESEETTHISIVDRWGNAVANTYTLNASYGSGVVVAGAGFLLNNEMDDFSVKPGHSNRYGLVGNRANAIEPGKRMLSSMTPTFVYNDNGLYLVLGSPGGSTIPTAVLQVMLRVVDHGLSLRDAVSAGRFHEQYLPDRIFIENGALARGTIDGLLAMGHKIEIRRPIGEVQAIMVGEGRLTGVSDPRGAGRAAGH